MDDVRGRVPERQPPDRQIPALDVGRVLRHHRPRPGASPATIHTIGPQVAPAAPTSPVAGSIPITVQVAQAGDSSASSIMSP